MGRFSSFLLLLCVIVSSAATTAHGNEVSYAPGPHGRSPTIPGPLPSCHPCRFEISTSSWLEETDRWPAPYSSETTVEEAFGADAEQVYGQVSLLDGLSSTGDDGFSHLLKEGVTALLNSVDKQFKYTDHDIKKSFSFKTALRSEAAATMQAMTFEDANLNYAFDTTSA